MSQIDIDGTVNPQPCNSPKVQELLATALAAGGFTIPPIVLKDVGPEDTVLSIGVEAGTYNEQQIAAIVAILDAVAADPTRNGLTDEQQEAADLQNKLNNVLAAITELGTITDALEPTAFTAANPQNADKIAALRGHLRNVSQDLTKACRAVAYLLRLEKKRQTGVFKVQG